MQYDSQSMMKSNPLDLTKRVEYTKYNILNWSKEIKCPAMITVEVHQ